MDVNRLREGEEAWATRAWVTLAVGSWKKGLAFLDNFIDFLMRTFRKFLDLRDGSRLFVTSFLFGGHYISSFASATSSDSPVGTIKLIWKVCPPLAHLLLPDQEVSIDKNFSYSVTWRGLVLPLFHRITLPILSSFEGRLPPTRPWVFVPRPGRSIRSPLPSSSLRLPLGPSFSLLSVLRPFAPLSLHPHSGRHSIVLFLPFTWRSHCPYIPSVPSSLSVISMHPHPPPLPISPRRSFHSLPSLSPHPPSVCLASDINCMQWYFDCKSLIHAQGGVYFLPNVHCILV